MVDIGLRSIEGNADKIGMALAAWMHLAQEGPTPMAGLSRILNGLMTDPHFPNLEHVMGNLTDTAPSRTKPFIPCVQAAVIGWLLKEIDIHPTIARIGNFLMKAGIGGAEASAVLALITFSGAAHSSGAYGGSRSSGGSVW